MTEILEAFGEDPASQQIYMITGIRGCGKTVFMTETGNGVEIRRERKKSNKSKEPT